MSSARRDHQYRTAILALSRLPDQRVSCRDDGRHGPQVLRSSRDNSHPRLARTHVADVERDQRKCALRSPTVREFADLEYQGAANPFLSDLITHGAGIGEHVSQRLLHRVHLTEFTADDGDERDARAERFRHGESLASASDNTAGGTCTPCPAAGNERLPDAALDTACGARGVRA